MILLINHILVAFVVIFHVGCNTSEGTSVYYIPNASIHNSNIGNEGTSVNSRTSNRGSGESTTYTKNTSESDSTRIDNNSNYSRDFKQSTGESGSSNPIADNSNYSRDIKQSTGESGSSNPIADNSNYSRGVRRSISESGSSSIDSKGSCGGCDKISIGNVASTTANENSSAGSSSGAVVTTGSRGSSKTSSVSESSSTRINSIGITSTSENSTTTSSSGSNRVSASSSTTTAAVDNTNRNSSSPRTSSPRTSGSNNDIASGSISVSTSSSSSSLSASINNSGSSSRSKTSSGSSSRGSGNSRETDNGSKKAQISNKKVNSTENVLRYLSLVLVIGTLLLLLLFFFIALSSMLNKEINSTSNSLPESASTPDAISWGPNSWELFSFINFVQSLSAISLMELSKAPSFLLEYTDTFSWVNYNIRQSNQVPLHDGSSRILAENLLFDSIIRYAGRLGIYPNDLFYTALVAFVIFIACLVFVILILKTISRQYKKKRLSETELLESDDPDGQIIADDEKYLSFSQIVAGLCIAICLVSIFPLTAVSTFEIRYDADRKVYNWKFGLAIFWFTFLLFSIFALGIWIQYGQDEEKLEDTKFKTVWGSVYNDYKLPTRLFFTVKALNEVATGVLIGGLPDVPSQVVSVICVQVLYFFAIVYFNPFEFRYQKICVLIALFLKCVNFALVGAFLSSSSVSKNQANDFAWLLIGLNVIVFLLMLVRQLVILVKYLREKCRKEDEEMEEEECPYTDDLSARSPKSSIPLL